MATSPGDLVIGLQHPVLDAQHIFRQVLTAMSQPGAIQTTDRIQKSPDSLTPATYALILSLLDQDTPLMLSGSVDDASVRESLRFHNAIPLAEDAKSADFVICNESDRPDLEALNAGNETWPDQSCTLIIQCRSFTEGASYRATGPGIETFTRIRCSAIDTKLEQQRKQMMPLFPMGVDLVFTCDRQFFCLPRTTCLQVESD